jgi:hypothetical protein
MSGSRGSRWLLAPGTGSRPGGYAVRAHGIGSRPSGDVDLFTTWQHRDEFPELTSAVVSALGAAGYATFVIMSGETFARLIVTDLVDGREEKVELSADWRAHDPVQLDIGPVLHPDDAVANKVCALFGRALPRDGRVSPVRWTHHVLAGKVAAYTRLLSPPWRPTVDPG